MKLIFKSLLKVTILLLFSSSLVGAFVLTNKNPQTGPSDNQVISETREHWQQLSDSGVELQSVFVDERDVMAADRIRFVLSLVYQIVNEKTEHHEKHSVIYRLFDNTWKEHRY